MSSSNPKEGIKKDESIIKEPLIEAIEEDDEFEEFDPSKWDAHDEDAEDAQQWQDNWDDDDIEDDFTKNLRAELQRSSGNK